MSPKPKVVIAGTGAMACLFAARLAQYAQVTLLGTWPEGLAALSADGIRLQEADGSEQRLDVVVSDDPEDCAGTKLALVLVKSWQTERAAKQLARCLNAEGVALTLQNGLGNLEVLQQALGTERAALGVTTTGATMLGPGHVRSGGTGPTHLGRHPRLEPLAALLRQAGFMIEITDDLQALIWTKLAINTGINPLTAILRVPNGALNEIPHARSLMLAAAVETSRVAASLGVQLPGENIETMVGDVAIRTAKNHSSMLQDVLRGAPTEIDAICGAVVRHADTQGIDAPVNWTLWNMVRALVAASDGESR
jgi:2-dehydropantoate 2-reductase